MSEDWDKNSEGLVPDPIVKIRVKAILRMDKWDPNHREDNGEGFHQRSAMHPLPQNIQLLFRDIKWANGLEVAIGPPAHCQECFN